MAFLKNMFVIAAIMTTHGANSQGFTVPPECPEEGYCTVKPPEYDTYLEHFDELMGAVSKNIPNFGKSMSKCGEWTDDQTALAVDQNCQHESEVIMPFVLTSNSTAKLIVQSGFYEQKFTVTHCINHYNGRAGDGSQCLGAVISPQISPFEATCQTIKGEIKLYVYDTQTKELQRENLSVDVCCSCGVTPKDDFSIIMEMLKNEE